MITNPARLLPGGFWTVEMPVFLKCFVIGCWQEAVIGRNHKHHGRIDACRRHDPESTGQNKGFAQKAVLAPGAPVPAVSEPPLTREQVIAAMVAEVIRLAGQSDPPDGGKKARLVKPVPQLPPSGAQAVR